MKNPRFERLERGFFVYAAFVNAAVRLIESNV